MATTNRGAQQRPLRTCRSIGRRDGRQRTDRCKLLVPERKYEKGIGTPHTTLSGSLRGQCSWVCCTLTARVRFVLLYSPCILMRQRTAFCKPLPYRVRLHGSCRMPLHTRITMLDGYDGDASELVAARASWELSCDTVPRRCPDAGPRRRCGAPRLRTLRRSAGSNTFIYLR